MKKVKRKRTYEQGKKEGIKEVNKIIKDWIGTMDFVEQNVKAGNLPKKPRYRYEDWRDCLTELKQKIKEIK